MSRIDMSDTSEPKLNPRQAAKLLPSSRGDKPAHPSRVHRYMLDGATGPGGKRVRLAAIRCGRTWYTTASAIQAFCEALTPKLGDESESGLPRTSKARSQSADRTEKKLTCAGF